VPALHDGAYAFGLLLIIWFSWLGVVLFAARETAVAPRMAAGVPGATTASP
jgi:hypothetical protein